MIRVLKEEDYSYIISNLDEWWGGRHMTDMLPRLFFKHFNESSFVYVRDNKIQGFVVGFISNTKLDEAYIHFVGVNPKSRGLGVASALYESFSQFSKEKGVSKVSCVTSPVNDVSIKFHHGMGFKASGYNEDGSPVSIESYDGPGEDRVLFSRGIT